jgi:para-nitrobenzyl esterase
MQAANEPDWPPFGSTRAYMAFADAPHASERLLPGMYEFNEQVVCRRRERGDIGWNWNVGLASPKIPGEGAQCK